jgi:hypothetical protein
LVGVEVQFEVAVRVLVTVEDQVFVGERVGVEL